MQHRVIAPNPRTAANAAQDHVMTEQTAQIILAQAAVVLGQRTGLTAEFPSAPSVDRPGAYAELPVTLRTATGFNVAEIVLAWSPARGMSAVYTGRMSAFALSDLDVALETRCLVCGNVPVAAVDEVCNG